MRQLYPVAKGCDLEAAGKGQIYLFRVTLSKGQIRWFSLVEWLAAVRTIEHLVGEGYTIDVYGLPHEPKDDDAIAALLR